jgi:hypothetical protein
LRRAPTQHRPIPYAQPEKPAQSHAAKVSQTDIPIEADAPSTLSMRDFAM